MRVQVIHPGELGQGEVVSWQAMQQATTSLDNRFLSAEFAMTVGQFRQESRVAILADDQSVIGFFPFEMRRFGMGVPVSGWLSTCQGLIHAPGTEWDAKELLSGCGLSAWRFDNLIAEQVPFKKYHTGTAASPIIDLSDGFDAYDAKIRVKASRFCRELERKTRKLGREVGELRMVSDSRDLTALRTLMAWKSEQYRRTNHVDRFSRPWLADLLEALFASRTDNLSGLLSVLYAGDIPVAAQFGLRSRDLLVGWFTGYDARFSKYSPGLIQVRQMARGLASAGIHEIHMGKGAKAYADA